MPKWETREADARAIAKRVVGTIKFGYPYRLAKVPELLQVKMIRDINDDYVDNPRPEGTLEQYREKARAIAEGIQAEWEKLPDVKSRRLYLKPLRDRRERAKKVKEQEKAAAKAAEGGAPAEGRAIDHAHFLPTAELTHTINTATGQHIVVKLLKDTVGHEKLQILSKAIHAIDHDLSYTELGEGTYGKVYVFDNPAFRSICVKVMFPHRDSGYFSFADMPTGGKGDSTNLDAFLASPEYTEDAKGIYPRPFFNSYKDRMWVQVMERLVPLKEAPALPAYRKCLAEFGLHTFRHGKASLDNKVWNFARRPHPNGKNQYVRIDLPATTQGTFPFSRDLITNSSPLRQTVAGFPEEYKRQIPAYFNLSSTPVGPESAWRTITTWVDSVAALLFAMYPIHTVVGIDDGQGTNAGGLIRAPSNNVWCRPLGANVTREEENVQKWALELVQKHDRCVIENDAEIEALTRLWLKLQAILTNTYRVHEGILEERPRHLTVDKRLISDRVADPALYDEVAMLLKALYDSIEV